LNKQQVRSYVGTNLRRLKAKLTTKPVDPNRDVWFWEHFDQAANETIAFLAEAGITLQGKNIVDVGCGDGFTDLGIATKASPAKMTGFDINMVDTAHLLRLSGAQAEITSIPANLHFEVCGPTSLPIADDSVDVAMSWSAFEHIGSIETVAGEISRVLRPDGAAFIQVWPLYHSEHGSHLWDWFPEGFVQLRYEPDEIERQMHETEAHAERREYMLGEFRTLNKATLDDIQAAFLGAGLGVVRSELLTNTVNLPLEVSTRFPLTDLMVTGFKLVLIPVPAEDEQPAS